MNSIIDIKYPVAEVRSSVIVGTPDDHMPVLPYLVAALSSYGPVYAFIDKQLMLKSPIVRELAEALQGLEYPIYAVAATEEGKTLESVMDMCSWLIDKAAGRDATLLAVGGGITTDMVGFAASIYKRGVEYISVPTTLLSQVDAGIGGKTGVNFRQYKNMLGVIKQPVFTFLWPELIVTLPRRDFLSGVAELLKTYIIDNSQGCYNEVVAFLKSAENQNIPVKYIRAAAEVKAGVVSRDPLEKGERRILNLGHTFAHAIESLAQTQDAQNLHDEGNGITHGEAVAMGIIMAARLAEKLTEEGRFDAEKGLTERLVADFKACGLPVYAPYGIEDMAAAMKVDKKAEGGRVHFVLPRAIGSVEIVDLSVAEVVNLLNSSPFQAIN